jgi:hypothetical protein
MGSEPPFTNRNARPIVVMPGSSADMAILFGFNNLCLTWDAERDNREEDRIERQ